MSGLNRLYERTSCTHAHQAKAPNVMLRSITLEDFADQCRSKGIKLTAQRQAVAWVLVNERDRPDAEEVHALANGRGARVSLSTVYRTLGVLSDADLVIERMYPDGRRRYQLAGRPNHHHLIDDQNGTIIEFSDPVIERAHQMIAHQLGYRLISAACSFMVFGCGNLNRIS
jgi:Fur family ferric uptake transcriptional regulator